jgi:hypothetical protein
LFHADKETDMTKLIVAFRNFANAPKNQASYNILFIQAELNLIVKVQNVQKAQRRDLLTTFQPMLQYNLYLDTR